MYETIPKQLRTVEAQYKRLAPHTRSLIHQAAHAIEDLTRQRDRVYARICEWCGACPPGKRNPEDCEIAAIGPDYTSLEPPKEEEQCT